MPPTPDHRAKTPFDHGHGDEAFFIFPCRWHRPDWPAIESIERVQKIKSVFLNIGLPLVFIPLKPHYQLYLQM